MKTSVNDKGISLIALVITIIVLLIMSGITIANLSGENGLLDKAKSAKEKSIESQQLEEETIEELNDTLNDRIDDTVADRTGIEVGDYIDYLPDVISSTVYPKSKLTTYSGSTNNNYDIPQDTLDWQVLRIYSNGSMDIIGSPTSKTLNLKGVLGYTNGVYLMDDICKTLYSRNSSDIIARNVKLQDFEYWLSSSRNGVTSRNSYISETHKYGDNVTYTTSNKYPPFYKTQKNESDPGSLTTDSSYAQNGDLTVKQTAYIIPLNENNYSDGYKVLACSTGYVVASRCVNCLSSYNYFSFYYATSTYFNCLNIFLSYGNGNESEGKLRPVVHLKPKVKITVNEGTSSDKHEITSY